MSEMVERVADALENMTRFHYGKYTTPNWWVVEGDGREPKVAQCDTMKDAAELAYKLNREREGKTAIAAMREPTEAMVEAGMNVGAVSACHGEVRAHYQAAIDEALK